MNGNSVYHFVLSSSVRVDIVSRLATARTPTDELIDSLDASKSAVYTALGDLERRGVVTEPDDAWRLTGLGRLLADRIEGWKSVEGLLAQDRDYWENHQTELLPERFRHRLPELGEYDVIRSDPPDVRAHSRAIISRLESAESCRTALPIYVPEYKDAFPNHPDSQAILPPNVMEQLQTETERTDRERARRNPAITNRVSEVDFGILIGDSFMMLGLPPQDEESMETLVTSTEDTAIQWATELFEELWRAAEPLDSYLEREYAP